MKKGLNLLKLKCLTSIFIGFLLNINLGLAQNLVSNPSFEQHEVILNNNIFYSDVMDWYSPSTGTPDYFHVQNTNYFSSTYGVPSNILGFQNPLEGQSYIGISTFVNQGQGSENAREYAQIKLTDSLISCATYHLIFFTSLSDSVNFATNKLGIALTTDSIFRNDYYCFSDVEPLICVNKDSLIIKNRWVKTELFFVAQGGEQFLTIGNFNLDNDLIIYNNNTSSNINYEQSYYFLDDISLTLFSDATMPATAGPDINLTEGDSVFIGQEISNLNCTWSILGGSEIADSISGIYVQPTQNTTYVVEQNLCGVITYDTVTVFVHGVGVSSLEGGQRWVTIYPNPNNGSFEIDLSQLNSSLQEISILDASGRIVFEDKSVSSKNKLSIQAHLEKGVYFLRVSSEKGVFEEKIIIQ